jgi:hypothetical protein
MKLVQAFYDNTLDLNKLNMVVICLIPKKENANEIKNYRPISLINCSVKIITKCLTDRLASCMNELIDRSQTAFIKGRYIMDNIVIANEVLHSVRVSKVKGVLFKLDFEKAYDRVNWGFLLDVLKQRGFGNRFITWIKNLLDSGNTCVNLNGEYGNYFKCHRGLRQGDPLSPFLFNLVADVLNKILQKAKDAGFLQGLGDFPNFGNVLNLHFADDTLIFLKADRRMINSLKWILLCFENLSGLKINFDKSEMVPLNLTHEEGQVLATQLGCKVVGLPITYLGVPLHWKKIQVSCWESLIDKIDKRLQGWKGKLLSLGGRVTLLNAVLSSIPLYWLSFYRMPRQIMSKIDRIRRRFLWSGTSRKRLPLIAWCQVCRGKDQGGLGLLNLHNINRAFLAKWLMRFYDDEVTGTWKHILMAKYGLKGDVGTPSHFWKEAMKENILIEIGTSWQVGNGCSVRFWDDRWIGQISLSAIYPNLYHIAYDKNILVSQVFQNNSISIDFARQLIGVYQTEWHELVNFFRYFQLSHSNDKILWRWSTKGQFSVHSLYTWLDYGGIPNFDFKSIWSAHMPLKIKIFVWLLKQNRILTKDNLCKKGWNGDKSCVFCQEEETVNHLFLHCQFVRCLWNWIANYNGFTFGCATIAELWDIDGYIPMKDPNVVEMIRGAVLWCVWLERNRLIFRGATAKSLQNIGAQIISLVKFWCHHQTYEANTNLTCILPCDTKDLVGGLLTSSMEEEQVIIPLHGLEMILHDGQVDGCDG